ncbi:hypothetical protein [Streptomyces sp. NPDC026659]|uniref:hypothetical protein n=1 Tax=Streptomyces sp. NPDC026659 TaxID=3155123 RepID=UPI0033F73777
MLTEDEARRLVLRELAQSAGAVHLDLAISRVEPVSFGWVFHWCARQDIDRPAGRRPSLGGNGPFLVDRKNKRLIRTAPGKPLPQQIADYERRLRRETHSRNAAAKRAVRQSQQPGLSGDIHVGP